jgi:hypothetical protein
VGHREVDLAVLFRIRPPARRELRAMKGLAIWLGAYLLCGGLLQVALALLPGMPVDNPVSELER